MKQQHNAKVHRIPLPLKKRNKTRLLFRILTFISCFLFTSGGHFNFCNMPSTRDAYITGNEITLSAPLSGRVALVHSSNTGRVQKGDLLVRMDDTDALRRYKKAEYTLSETVKITQARYATDDRDNTRILKAQMAYRQALSDYHRQIKTGSTAIISKQDLQHALKAVSSSQKALDAAIKTYRQRQQSLKASDIPRQQVILQATEEFQEARRALLRTEVRSPVNGYIARRNIHAGLSVSAGQTLMTIVPADQMWVTASFKATQLSDLLIGQKVSVITDFYGMNVVFDGHVEGITQDTDTVFTALPAQNGEGNWINDMQRIPVRISLNPLQLSQYPLWPGLSSQVTLLEDDSRKMAAFPGAEQRE